MKIILSRKGFDSQYGQIPSPILSDGTLLSLPIPSKMDPEVKFKDLHHGDLSYYDIIRMLSPRSSIKENHTCHLDPDIRSEVKERPMERVPSFGQEKAALRHLQNQNVGIGDVFLFFGWFRQTQYIDNRLVYTPNAPDLHVIYGYFPVGGIINRMADVPAWLKDHPHVKADRWNNPNVIFTASQRLSLCPGLPGAACFQFDNRLVLTKSGCKRSTWDLPHFFRGISISYNKNSWKEDCFVAASKGQEFVFEANDGAVEWIKNIISPEIVNSPHSIAFTMR